ncbi:MAG: AIR synthase family protein [Candidatus Aminicenantes bacterium]|nr:AIR synthase family protein [Candidatus Aminicenantes bacterium]
MAETKFPDLGKISPEFFQSIIYPRLGSKRAEVLVGPQHGVDIGIIRFGSGKVMAVTTDPIYVVPQFGWDEAAWFAWHILASDVTTSGFPPAYIIPDWNLPLTVDEKAFTTIWERWHVESLRYGATIIAGHTARYTGTDFPMVGGATFIAVGEEEKYVTPQMAQPGDYLIITKGPAIEATAIMATLFYQKTKSRVGRKLAEAGRELFFSMSTVEDALTVAQLGLRTVVTSLHDATEGGVLGGVYEVAVASGTGIFIDLDKISLAPAIEAIGQAYHMDPFISISEGTLIITLRPEKSKQVLEALQKKNIPAFLCGEILPLKEGRWVRRKGATKPLQHPRIDPFWRAVQEASEE